ncbi:MAG TPA: UvrD-helicase domain-containing protein [Gaiellaceae bacterium]|jgi:ATP-dependent exoDNAse (exonuclease V) beta subunit|nr:UvrD-helicase domain-containing protein [Gaiellaceae bacterium]
MSAYELNREQAAAVEAGGEVFVSAGAGTGKTAVLVERVVRAVIERGLDVDSILVITYTRRAAGELRMRIRAALAGRGRHDLARELDGAWISTIHGFCARLLRAYPLAAGLDPRFRELDEAQAAVLRSEAFREALAEFCAGDDPQRLELLATYGSDRLRRMLTSVYETLRAAGRELDLAVAPRPELGERVDELRAAAASLVSDPGATEAQQRAAAELLELLARDLRPDRLMSLGGFRARGDRASAYCEALGAVEQAALDEAAARDRALLQELLTLFAERYAQAKARESALDFEDLQLEARNLLRAEPELRRREQERFRSILVDEFQDTNRLQTEIVDLLRTPETELFFVGDEFQSIYGFRHADVQVFRERREAVGQPLSLTLNYRSRPEVLAAVNELFGAHFGGEFQELAAAAEFPDPVFGHPVELLVTDKESYKDSGVHWRRGEARAVARRVRELVNSGAATPGEIVLLFAAGTDAEWYEDELRRAGLPTYRATGKGYFGQQQVVDLLMYLRLLHNRYDDTALASVLASPFVGVSNDALALLRRVASRRPLFSGLEHSLPPGLAERDERLMRAFRQRYDRLVEAMPRLSLERLCEQIVAEHDYDLAVLAQWDGRRRYANMRKLARLARSYDELRGPDVEGFVRFVAEQEAVGARELEAVAEEEGADAVRLLTIHAAKGLEFKVVIVADAGRDRVPPSPDEILALPDGRFGFRVADPVTARRRGAFDYEAVKEARQEAERAERLRLYYVAMTRAKERLIVSGSVDLGSERETPTPIAWVLDRLGADGDLAQAGDLPIELVRGDARLLVRLDHFHPEEPAVVEAESEEPGQLALFATLDEVAALPEAPELPPLVALADPPLHRVRRLSFTSLSLFEQCAYKYFARYGLGMSERPVEGEGTGEMSGTEIGSAVHALLEEIDLAAPVTPELEDELIRGFVAAYCESDLARRVAALEDVEKERHFTFEHDGVLVHGYIDVFYLRDGQALVVDYKTNALGEAAPDEIVEQDYRLQRLVYALACFRAGAKEVEVVYHFLERPDAPVGATFMLADVVELEAELSAAIERIQAGEFPPTPSDFACGGCPALDLVCAGPRLRARLPEAVAS